MSSKAWIRYILVFVNSVILTLIVTLTPVLIYYRQSTPEHSIVANKTTSGSVKDKSTISPVGDTSTKPPVGDTSTKPPVRDTSTKPLVKDTTNVPGDKKVTSPSGQYRYASVASDAAECSTIGVNILAKKSGSAVDAAIATMICAGVVNAQSTGIGGGHFMTIYNVDRNSSVSSGAVRTILARERAPLAATSDMFMYKNVSSITGGKAIAVPGEVAGFYHEWKKFGRVPWSELFTPTIALCRKGHVVNKHMAYALERKKSIIKKDPLLRNLLMKPDGTLYKEGDILKRPKLAKTLEIIADDPLAFYNNNSQLAKDIVADIQDYGGIITLQDLQKYYVYDKPPLAVHLQTGNLDVYGPPPPSSGVIVEFILKVLDGYQFSSKDYKIKERKFLSHHRIVEAFKFAFAKRSELGDEDYVQGVKEFIANLTSDDTATYIRSKITDNQTHDIMYYEPAFELPDDKGTSHTSVLAPDGSAVAITSSVNYHFGATVLGKRTGIFFNNLMDDFSTPGLVNIYGFPSSPNNFIVPGKMPMSSMSPVIVRDRLTGDVKLVTGAAGASRIITTVASIILNTLWFNITLQEATDMPRMHHQLLPNTIQKESNFDEALMEDLKSKGHQFKSMSTSVAQSILVTCNNMDVNQRKTCIHSVSDRRKKMAGKPDGY